MIKFGLFLIVLASASETKENEDAKSGEEKTADLKLVKIEEEEYTKEPKRTSKFIGVGYNKKGKAWQVSRRSKNQKKIVCNGSYKDEETAAHASDTLARNLMANGEQNHELNFPDNHTEVYPEVTTSSIYIGVTLQNKTYKKYKVWSATRRSKHEKKTVYNGYYKDEETAAHASDTLARKLLANGEQNHELNFPDKHNEVYPDKVTTSSIYVGVSRKGKEWRAERWSINEKKSFYNGSYKDEGTAAQASDTLARKLLANGEQKFKFNFPKDDSEAYHQRNKRKRSNRENLGHSKTNNT